MSFAPSQGGALASQVLSLGGGTLTGPILAPNGTAAAPSYSWSTSGFEDDGFFHAIATQSIVHLSLGGVSKVLFYGSNYLDIASDMSLAFHSGTNCDSGSPDVYLTRDAAAVLALKNGTTAQEFRVYGTTTGTKYGAFAHNATDTVISGTFGNISLRNVDLNTAANTVDHTSTATITGAVTDGYTAGLRLTPTYSAATALTVTRHNYIDLNGPTLSGAGPAALTDAAVFRFNAAAGTHKATVGATTKTTPGAVDAWVKINMNGTILYMPAYTSTTA